MLTRSLRGVLVLAVLLGLGIGLGPEPGSATSAPSGASRAVPLPTLSEPPPGLQGHPMWDSWHDLRPFGYTEHEYFVSGTATAADGTTAPYTTRFIVTRPRRERDFNGTVMLDWVNVTAQFENAVDTLEAREMLLREGYAFVHVSAQAAGLCCTPLTPQVWDPVRYAAIDHPGDDYSQDMFSQIARTFRAPVPGHLDPMGGLKVERILAVGQSQSASRLFDYINHNQRRAGVIDGFLVHGGGEKSFPHRLPVPVLMLLSDWNEADGRLGTDPNYRLWEVAGTAHSDLFIGYQQVRGQSTRLVGLPAMDRAGYDATIETAGNYGQIPSALDAACTVAGATMPMHYAVSAAIHHLDSWVRTGVAPTQPPLFTLRAGETTRDRFGNVRGGIRLPPVAVPVASYRSTVCQLGGITVPFTRARIHRLYPTFTDYQSKMRAATDLAVRRGWLLPRDAVDQMRRACALRQRYAPADRGRCRAYHPPRFGD